MEKKEFNRSETYTDLTQDVQSPEDLNKLLVDSCMEGNLEEVKSLIEQGVDIHVDKDRPLRWAANNGHLKIVKVLVKKGANIHAKNNKALRWAAQNGNLKIVKYLVKKGADIHAENGEAMHFALTRRHFKIAEFLWENGINFDLNEELYWAFKNNDFETVNYLFSLCVKKEKVLKTILEKLPKEDKKSIIKKFIANHDLDLDTKFLGDIKFPNPDDRLKPEKRC